MSGRQVCERCNKPYVSVQIDIFRQRMPDLDTEKGFQGAVDFLEGMLDFLTVEVSLCPSCAERIKHYLGLQSARNSFIVQKKFRGK